MKQAALILLLILGFAAIWWFWGREAYISVNHPSEPVLLYHIPKWNGWDIRGLRWQSDIPQELKEAYPGIEGWWHYKQSVIPLKDIPFRVPEDSDWEDIVKAGQDIEKYFIWVPLDYWADRAVERELERRGRTR